MAFNFTHSSDNADASFIVHTDKLKQFISVASMVVPSKSTFNILKHVLIHSDKSGTFIRVTDCTVSIDFPISDSAPNGEFNIAVDYLKLRTIVEHLPRGMVTIERISDNVVFKSVGTTNGTITGVDGGMYPTINITGTQLFTYTLEASLCSYVCSHLVSITCNDGDYPGIRSILVEYDGTMCNFVATDRKLLVGTNMDMNPVHKIVIPNIALKLLNLFRQDFQCVFYEGQYSFTSNLMKVYGAYDNGLYPNVHYIIPKSSANTYKVDIGVFKAELKVAATGTIPTTKGIRPVYIKFCEDTIHVTSVPPDYKFNDGGIKMDAEQLDKLVSRFDVNSDVVFKAPEILERPTIWKDCRGTSLLCCLR